MCAAGDGAILAARPGLAIGRLLQQLNADGQTLVLVTHDAALAERYAARTVRLLDGRLATAGVPA